MLKFTGSSVTFVATDISWGSPTGIPVHSGLMAVIDLDWGCLEVIAGLGARIAF